MREKWLTMAVIGVVGLALVTYQFVYSVSVNQVAAHYRMGKVMRVIRPKLAVDVVSEQGPASLPEVVTYGPGTEMIEDAGWFFKMPWPFDEVKFADQRVRFIDGPLAQTQLPDGNQIIPRVYATWRIMDPVAFYKSLKGSTENAQQRLKTILGNKANEVFGSHNLADVVNTDQSKLKFKQIEEEIFAGVQQDLSQSQKAYGIEICSLGITWVALPEDVTQAVFDRMQAERRTVAETLKAEGEAIKRTKVAEAVEKRDKIMADAQAEAKRIRAVGEAEAAQYYVTFAKDQDLAVFLRRLEALRVITDNAARNNQPMTLVITTKTEPFSLLESAPLKMEATSVPPMIDLPVLAEPAAAAPAVGEAR